MGDLILKKIILFLFCFTLIMMYSVNKKDILIPNNAIRFRVIANSDTLEDQSLKLVIKDKIEKEVYSLISNASSNEQVRSILESNIKKIESIIESYNVPYNVSYGLNYFPSKNYKGVLYNAGNYESLVITLGSGAGSNFWCVLFPPLCLLDYNSDMGDVEYRSYVKELLDKF